MDALAAFHFERPAWLLLLLPAAALGTLPMATKASLWKAAAKPAALADPAASVACSARAAAQRMALPAQPAAPSSGAEAMTAPAADTASA